MRWPRITDSSLGIPDYISIKEVKEAKFVLDKLNEKIPALECTEASSLLKLCLDEKVDMSLLIDVVSYIEESDAIVRISRKYVYESHKKIREDRDKLIAEGKDPVLNFKNECRQDLNSVIYFFLDGYMGELQLDEYLTMKMPDLKKEGTSCALYLKEKEEAQKKAKEELEKKIGEGGRPGGYYGAGFGGGIQIGFGGGMITPPPTSGFGTYIGQGQAYPYIDAEMDFLALGPVMSKIMNLKPFRNKLLRKLEKISPKIKPEDLLAQSLNNNCSSRSDNDIKTLANFLLGQEHFHMNQEYSARKGRKNESFSPNNIFKALRHIQLDEKEEHPHDRIRRKACENFIL